MKKLTIKEIEKIQKEKLYEIDADLIDGIEKFSQDKEEEEFIEDIKGEIAEELVPIYNSQIMEKMTENIWAIDETIQEYGVEVVLDIDRKSDIMKFFRFVYYKINLDLINEYNEEFHFYLMLQRIIENKIKIDEDDLNELEEKLKEKIYEINKIKDIDNLINEIKDNKPMKKIKEKLKQYREERNLRQKDQYDGLLANLLEEATEYERATLVEDKVDALCDMAVFMINADCDKAQLKTFYTNGMDFVLKDILEEIRKLGFDPYKALNETIKEISSRTGKFDKSINKFIKDKGAYDVEQALELLEKELGFKEFDKEDENFWYKNDFKIKKWIRANYENARLRK